MATLNTLYATIRPANRTSFGKKDSWETRLCEARDQMEEQITQWEKGFLLASLTSGVVDITQYWQKNHNIKAVVKR